MSDKTLIIPAEAIAQLIYLIRGDKVMLDSDLALLYGVPAKRLNEQVKRNRARFPEDFMFQLTAAETKSLRSQIATLETGCGREVSNLRSQFATSSWGGLRYLPYAFTEHGVAMLASVLKSQKAVEVNIAIVRTFIRLREILSDNHQVFRHLRDLEAHVGIHDEEIQNIFNAIKQLLKEPRPKRRKIGF